MRVSSNGARAQLLPGEANTTEARAPSSGKNISGMELALAKADTRANQAAVAKAGAERGRIRTRGATARRGRITLAATRPPHHRRGT
ncbi:hypothetical protein LBMAG39_02870 [Cyanobium sp.]|nr:hypothetical protein LBMAG39_02870 [Cyanobium sp.]